MKSGCWAWWVLILLFAFAGSAAADSFMVAGQVIACPQGLIVEQDEVLAPLLAGCKRLGIAVQAADSQVKLTTLQGNQLVLTQGQKSAQVAGLDTQVRAAPRKVKGVWYLPVRSLAGWIGCVAQWNGKSRALALLPRITNVQVSRATATLRITVTGTAPLQYQIGRLSNPERLYLDFAHCVVDTPPEQRTMQVSQGPLSKLRVAQFSADPPTVRMVLDVSGETKHDVRLSEGDSVLSLDLAAPSLPAQPRLTPLAPVTIGSVECRVMSERLAQVVIHTTGRADVRCLHLPPSAELNLPDRLVVFIKGASIAPFAPQQPAADSPLQRVRWISSKEEGDPAKVVLDLRRPVAHTLTVSNDQIRVMLGNPNLSDLCILVDPGHGGRWDGAVARDGTCEKDLNLDMAKRLAELLEGAGAKVILTRNGDTSAVAANGGGLEDLKKDIRLRGELTGTKEADLFLSIHCNSYRSEDTFSGTETYYHLRFPEHRVFAESIQAKVVEAMELPDKGAKSDGRLYASGLGVLRRASPHAPACLVEVGFINNKIDRAKLKDPEMRQKAAVAMFEGIKAYVGGAEFLAQYEQKRGKRRVAAVPPNTPPSAATR